ncbi:MAG: AEC family transporter, partial [Clostridiales bacterium]|nr:AEC family transporter [Clostridiales bacterium]
IYSNCGFMGIPLVNALFGSEGVFYLTAFLTVFNLLIWTHGIIQISGVRSLNSLKKALLSPSIISIAIGMIFFLARISLPNIVYQSLDYVAMMNTPLAMLVAGATIAETNVLNAFKNIRIYWITLIKLAIIPLILLAIFRFISVEDTVKLTVITAMSAPTATMCTLFCLRYDKNSKYASEIFAVTTLISTATLPLVIWLAEL